MALFPRAAQSIRAHSLFFQAGQVRDKGIGVTSGMAVTRSSATAVAIASGNVRYGNAIVAYAGGSIGTIPAASSGKHRYDAIVYDGPKAAVKRLAGSEAVPDPYTGGFLNNKYPAPPELESETQILLAVIKVTQAGVVDENHGNYCVGGVADLRLLLSDKLGVTGGDSHNSLHDSTYAPRAKGVTNGDSHNHSGGDGAQVDHGSLGGLGDDDHSAVYQTKSLLTAAGDMIYASAQSTWAKLAKSTDGCRLALVSGLPAWITGKFGISFMFGDGSSVLSAQAKWVRVPIASKITKAYIRSADTDGVLKQGSITIAIYIHDYNGSIGSSSDSFSLSTASYSSETGLAITVAAGKYITAIISGITTCEQVSLDLELEAT